jgi:hypothetical protein
MLHKIHFQNGITCKERIDKKMPIILISVDSANKNLSEFDKMGDVVVDIVLESTDLRSTAIGDYLSTKMTLRNRLPLDRLDERGADESEVDAGIRMQAAVNMIRKMKVQNGIIISHHSVFNSWNKGVIKDEWEIIGMS